MAASFHVKAGVENHTRRARSSFRLLTQQHPRFKLPAGQHLEQRDQQAGKPAKAHATQPVQRPLPAELLENSIDSDHAEAGFLELGFELAAIVEDVVDLITLDATLGSMR